MTYNDPEYIHDLEQSVLAMEREIRELEHEIHCLNQILYELGNEKNVWRHCREEGQP